jgi:protein required for attachment to host cells
LRVVEAHEQDNPATHDQGTDRPGRRPDAGGPGRSAMEPTDWHQIAKERFAHEIADKLDDFARRGKFRHLVVVAPADTLAELRQSLHKETMKLIDREVDKDLTHHPIPDIEKILSSA